MCEIIKTGIDGLDAILNGGIIYEDSVVVIIRGRRGIFKTIMGMQAMLGIQKSFEMNRSLNEIPIRFYSLNKNDVILERMLKGMVISREVENIKKGRPNNLRSHLEGIGGGYAAFEEDIRHLLLTFDTNTDRFLRGEAVTPIEIKNNIANQIKLTLKGCGNGDSGSDYLQPSLVDFAEKMQDIENLPKAEAGGEPPHACIVLDGISRMTDEELERLPMEALKQSLRQRAKVSILIMNDRKPLRNLDADIIIDMRQIYDTVHNYTFHELNIVKNVKGQFAFGWQKYKFMNGLLYVYPSIHRLLSQPYSVDNTFIQAISTDGRYAQPFADMSAGRALPLSLGEGPVTTDYPDRRIPEKEKNDTPATKEDILPKLLTPHRVEKGLVTTIIGNHNTFKRFLASITILNSIMSGHEVLVLLLNERRRGMLDLIDKIRKDAGINPEDIAEAYQHLFFWEVRMGCISPEELISFVMEYIQMQKDKCPQKRIDIFFIDLATVEQCFPMINNESLFVPTLSTLCRERKVDLHFVCNKHFARRSTVCTVSDTLICTQRDPEDDNNQLTMLLEKNDFGPLYNSMVFELVVKQVYDESGRYNVATNSDGMVVFKNVINKMPIVVSKEIPTTKDYWRKTINMVDKNENPSE